MRIGSHSFRSRSVHGLGRQSPAPGDRGHVQRPRRGLRRELSATKRLGSHALASSYLLETRVKPRQQHWLCA